MLHKILVALLGTLSLAACAAEPGATVSGVAAAKVPVAARPAATRLVGAAPVAGAPAAGAPNEAAIRVAMAKAVPGVKIDRIQPSPLPGYQEVVLSGRVVYASNDGRYLLQGSLIRLADREDLTRASEAVLRRGVLDSVGSERRIIFPAANPRHRVTVFTDIDCGFCRKLHTQIADYNKAGITVEYLFFPRAGLNSESYDKAVSVWCASDRQRALTDAKADRPVPKRTCPNPVSADYALGQRVGVDGTPAIYAADGTQIGGYLSPKEMIERLDAHAATAKLAASAAAPALAGN